ncbi:UDP-N-acetyl-D-mannosaminuronic acid dehydrogenase [Pseudonocardia hierapolitana]|uniref:UDP-N-acetyl-D-mannosaminuronic acid dehydrogenase n=1 Tax=Pseudonocardia hierapolitana TaxID=1128676 RepID=A0A561SVZ2_9PSEU|nr:nucleotide sugar dehydrogenase [Pseudonocardia hierapolitana]TWF79033.1 UDP-N-acetyl-D-mannosaminuronic acid dehydrogenase [Pseudonocardia hierapolitana]
MTRSWKVGIVGMGYVGLTLAAAMARRGGYEVHGVDVQPAVVESLSRGEPHIFEPGVGEAFEELVGEKIFVASELPDGALDAVVICVSTPVDGATHEPYLDNLVAAAEHVAERCRPGTLVVVRSTVPVGASRQFVLPPLLQAWGEARLVMAPERTIQGQALRELAELPQVIGGLDQESLELGVDLFSGLARQLVPVSSLEAAELVKLANNCHTDVIYSFGNEIAMLTERLGLDPLEVIRATNLDYPRPDIAKPGYVGGGCLSKDPYLMLSGAERHGYTPQLIKAARTLNENLPVHVARRVVDLMPDGRGGTLTVLGWAYKGWPPTDDMRGTPIAAMMPVFAAAGIRVLGHDPRVRGEVIRAYGGEPVGLAEGFRAADGVLIVTDHPEYRGMDVAAAIAGSRLRFVFDSWRILDADQVTACGVHYAALGFKGPDRSPAPTGGVFA